MQANIKNLDTVEHTWAGQTLQPQEIVSVHHWEWDLWFSDSDFESACLNSQASVTIGPNTYLGSAALDALKNLVSDGDSFIVSQLATPASSTAPGIKGQICFDANYLYVCVADNQWKRIPLQSF